MDDEHLEQLDAYIQVAVLGAYADGVLADEERLVIRECVAAHAPDEEAARLMFSFTERLPSRGRPLSKLERTQRITEIKAVLTSRVERERAFVLAVDIVNAKGGVGVRESSVLLQLMFDLEVDGDFARRIVEETSRGTRGASRANVTPRQAATLTIDGGWGDVSETERRPPDFGRTVLTRSEVGMVAPKRQE